MLLVSILLATIFIFAITYGIVAIQKFLLRRTEIGYTIVKILQRFPAIENRDPVKQFVEVYKITTASRNGAKVGFPTP